MQQNLLVATPTFVAFAFSRNGRLVTDKAKVSALGASNGVNCATTQVIAYIYDLFCMRVLSVTNMTQQILLHFRRSASRREQSCLRTTWDVAAACTQQVSAWTFRLQYWGLRNAGSQLFLMVSFEDSPRVWARDRLSWAQVDLRPVGGERSLFHCVPVASRPLFLLALPVFVLFSLFPPINSVLLLCGPLDGLHVLFYVQASQHLTIRHTLVQSMCERDVSTITCTLCCFSPE